MYKININKNFKNIRKKIYKFTHISAAINLILFFFCSKKLKIMLFDMVQSATRGQLEAKI